MTFNDRSVNWYSVKIHLLRQYPDGSIDIAFDWPKEFIDHKRPNYFEEIERNEQIEPEADHAESV